MPGDRKHVQENERYIQESERDRERGEDMDGILMDCQYIYLEFYAIASCISFRVHPAIKLYIIHYCSLTNKRQSITIAYREEAVAS